MTGATGGRLSDRSDAELLALHADGDPDAFGEVVRRHRDRLWAVALRTLGDREEAADAVQDALVSALRASRRADGPAGAGAAFRGEAAVTTWLHRIVVNACLDRVRRAKVRPTDPWPERDLAATGPDPIAARERSLDLQAALAVLPADQRAALVLVDMYGWPVDEAAAVLDCAPGTVKSRCSRGRARLLRELRATDPTSGNLTDGNLPDGNLRDSRRVPPSRPEHPAPSAPSIPPAGGEHR